MKYRLILDPDKNRMQAIADGKTIGLIDYRIMSANVMVIYHTEVAGMYEGQGIAADMTKTLLDFARDNGYSVRPLCPYAVAYIEEHPECQDILYK